MLTVPFRLFTWTLTAVVGAVLAPPVDPLVFGGWLVLPVGVLIGIALFLTVAGRRLVTARLSRRRLVARSGALTLKSAQEEVVWRGLLLGTLVGPLGHAAALALTTCAFSIAHAAEQGRRALVHLGTGAVFGLVYLGSGRLSAAVAAHAAYNVAIGASSPGGSTLSVSDTRQRAPLGLRSRQRRGSRLAAVKRPMPSDAAPLAALRDVHKSFGETRALAGVSLVVEPGEIVGLLGPNGAGKSTAVSLLLGLRRPESGTARLLGSDPRDPDAHRRLGVVLQDVGFPPSLKLREIVELVCAHFVDPITTSRLLDRAGLGELADRQAGGLSGGQKRRLAFALALAGNPELLFLDEPTAGMDVTARRELYRELRAFASAGGGVLLTTQQLEEAEQLSTRLVVLARGAVLATGTVAEVRSHASRTRITFRAERLPPLPESATVESLSGHHVVYTDDPDAFVASLVRSGAPYRDLEVSRSRLEDAFVTLTEGR